MNAIFGIINKKGFAVDDASLNKISLSMQHRAFDGMETWRYEAIALGQCNINSWQQQEKEAWPIVRENIVVTADIRIDNRQELIRLLNTHKEASDSNLLLSAYLKWGENCIYHLEGEYVFCIWNKLRKRLFIATDHIGYRPLFYYNSADLFIFCSEMKGVLSVKPGPHYFNEDSLMEYHHREGNPAWTYDSDVFALSGGSRLILQDGVPDIKKYWDPRPLNKYRFTKDEEWTDCLKDLLTHSIEKRVRTDKPIGVMLSGGLDSTPITCILAKVLADKNLPLYAFSSVLSAEYTGTAADERKYIEIVRKYCPNLEQTYVEAPEDGPFINIEQAFESDECFPNIFSYMDRQLAVAAAQKKIGTFFIGYGGDYWVSWKGKTVVYQLLQSGHWKEAIQLMKKLNKNGGRLLQLVREEYVAHTTWYKKIQQFIKKEGSGRDSLLQEKFSAAYPPDPFSQQVRPINIAMQQIIGSGRWSRTLGTLANRYAGYGMQSAIPLTDKSINEFMMDVPLALFRKEGHKRSLIRHAMQDIIPPEIQWRNSKGKYVPDYVNHIMQQKTYIEDTIRSDKYDFAFNRYLSKERMQSLLADVSGKTSLNKEDEQILSALTQATISAQLLLRLKDTGYNFS